MTAKLEVPTPRHSSPLVFAPGAIRVASVRLVVDHEDAVVYEIECHSKYPDQVLSFGGSFDERIEGEVVSLQLFADSRTLRADRLRRGPSSFEFLVPEGERWNGLVTTGRYSVVFSLYRQA